MHNTDTRIQVTRTMFHQAMLALLEEKAIGFISVKELCARAGLNRGTFYLHYSEPIDVLHEMEEIVQEKVNPVITDSIYEDLPAALALIRENSRLVAVVIGHNGDPTFLKGVRNSDYQRMEPKLLSRYPKCSAEEVRTAFDFLFSGCTGAVTAWLQNQCKEPTDQFAKRLARLCESVFNTLKG